MMEQERAFFKANGQFEQIKQTIQQAAKEGKTIDDVERELWQSMLIMGRTLLEGFVELQGTGDLGPTLEHEERTLRRLDQCHVKRFVSVFGEIQIHRTVYGTRENQKHEMIPLDARLNLPEGEFSYLLQDWDQVFCTQGSYSQSIQTVERILGIGQSVRSLEHMNRNMAQDVESFHQSQTTPDAKEEGSILVLTADGKGVPMRRSREDSESVSSERRKKGEKANKKRQACVGAVYTIDPFPRTADDIVDEVMRKIQQEKRPAPCHKRIRAELSREEEGEEVNGKDVIFAWGAKEIQARNESGEKPVIGLMDGDRALWKKLDQYAPNAIRILDLFHVMERLWKASHCFYAEGSDDAKDFVTDRLKRLLQGDVGRVIGGLKQMQTKKNLRGNKKKQLQAVITYLENNRDYMQYDYYLDFGYPIGSGVVEGACRHLVKDRMELTGMRWTTEGAQAMLDLRAINLNGDWDEFQQCRIEDQQEILYPYREWIQSQWDIAA
jgi:hypothetical protein